MKIRSSRLIDVAIWLAAVPGWVLLHIIVVGSPGFGGGNGRYFLAPFVIGGMTWAIHRLLRGGRHAWAMSALLAGVLPIAMLFVVAAASNRWS